MKNILMSFKSGRLAVALVAMFTLVAPCQAKFKCWTNNEGVKECGNAVPPEYAQQGHEVMNKHGVARESKKAKTLEELAAEREAEKLAAAAAVEQEKRAKLDRVLLDTFTSEDDMVLTRDGQIAHFANLRIYEGDADAATVQIGAIIEAVNKLRELSPLFDMHNEGIDISQIQWSDH